MVVYWCLFSIVTINTFLGHLVKNKYINRIGLFISFISMFLLSAMRKGIGDDYFNYLIFFRKYQSGVAFARDVEIGYALLNKICITLGLGFNSVIVVSSFLCCFPVYYLARKIDKPLVLYVYFLLFYPMSYCIIRQCIGSSIAVLCTYYFIEPFFNNKNAVFPLLNNKDKSVKYVGFNGKVIVLALLSCSFHKVLVIYFLVLFASPFLNINTLKKAIPIASISALIGLKGAPLLAILTSIFANGSYSRYFIGGKGSGITAVREVNSGLGIILRYFIYIITFVAFSIYLKKRSDREKNVYYLLYTAMIGFDAFAINSRVFLRLKFLFLISYLIPFFSYKRMSGKNDFVLVIQLFGALALIGYAVAFRYQSEFYAWSNVPYNTYLNLPF